MKRVLSLFIFLFAIQSVSRAEKLVAAEPGSTPLVLANGDLTAVILHDIFSPPVASRIYAYSNIAAYEGIRFTDVQLQPLTPLLKGFDPMPLPEQQTTYDFTIVGLRAFYATAKALVFSEADMEEAWEIIRDRYRDPSMPDSLLKKSILLGEQIAAAVIKRAKRDNYIQTRTYPRYKYLNSAGHWMPTPPDYAEGLEPYWNRIRPLAMDTSSQFKPEPPIPYDTSMSSSFMKQAIEVYESDSAEGRSREIARYWDDNPFATVYQGHFTFAIKKVTPGGHWIGITATALLQSKADIGKAAEAFALTSIAIFDGFISCWDEKYRSNYVRPVTVINARLDEKWKPFIQTPPFPEYTSGHSVISGAAATVLTGLFGSNFAFTDTLEKINELPERSFDSFQEAAEEASISRFYGGIHFKPTLVTSTRQGRDLGDYIVQRLRIRIKP